MNDDALRFFIMSEGGATAFLATAFARAPSGESSPYHASIYKALASLLGVELSPAGPQSVLVEDGNLDLVLLWGEWCIVFEVTIRSGSVRQGQLQEYYELLREGPDALSSRFPGAKALFMVFVTPGKVGTDEFASLAVRQPDQKAHLAWEDVLAAIDAALTSAAMSERPPFTEELLRAGSARVTGLLSDVRKRSAIQVTDEQRLARRQFAMDVQALVMQRQPQWATLFRPLWTAPTVEEAYLSLDERRQANAYFTVFFDSAVVLDGHGPSTLDVRWWVKVANQHRKVLGPAFIAIDRSATISQLGLSPELAADIAFDRDKLAVVLRAKMLGPRSELIDRCAQILERFVATFQKLLP